VDDPQEYKNKKNLATPLKLNNIFDLRIRWMKDITILSYYESINSAQFQIDSRNGIIQQIIQREYIYVLIHIQIIH